jgi:hypothetical protein
MEVGNWRWKIAVDVHHGFAHVFAGNDAFFLAGEVFVRICEQLEYFFNFVLLVAGYVVLFGELGLARALGDCTCGGADGSSALLGRLLACYV